MAGDDTLQCSLESFECLSQQLRFNHVVGLEVVPRLLGVMDGGLVLPASVSKLGEVCLEICNMFLPLPQRQEKALSSYWHLDVVDPGRMSLLFAAPLQSIDHSICIG